MGLAVAIVDRARDARAERHDKKRSGHELHAAAPSLPHLAPCLDDAFSAVLDKEGDEEHREGYRQGEKPDNDGLDAGRGVALKA